MLAFLRQRLHRFVPSHFHDPIGLTRRLIKTKDPAAILAIQSAILGAILSPLDLLLQPAERRTYRATPMPALPLIFVCGAPRSGTTVTAQVLIQHLPVAYINNLTALFPRSPLIANRLFGRLLRPAKTTYHSYYGKTVDLSGPHDGLHLWDRWLGKDRTRIRVSLTEQEKVELAAFFGALEHLYGKPVLNKNNYLNLCASLVADVLDQAHFICLSRDPVYLAQSLLQARLDIHGTIEVPYGLIDLADSRQAGRDMVEDVCRQVLFHERAGQEQQHLIGPGRFWIVPYESFCRNPGDLVERVSTQILGRAAGSTHPPRPLIVSNRRSPNAELFDQIDRTLARLRNERASQEALGEANTRQGPGA